MITLQKAFKQSKTQVLSWVQSSPFSHYYELRCGKQISGYLIWKKDNFSISGMGATNQGSWNFKFTRYIQPGLEIQEATSSLSAGIFHLDWSGRGQLALSDGQIFDWLPGDRWGKDWQFNHSSRIPLLYFQLHKKWLTIDAQIQATHETPGEPALSLMVLSGWFYLALNSAGKQTGILLNQ